MLSRVVMIIAICQAITATAAPFKSVVSQLSVDWSNQEIRFIGRSDLQNDASFRDAERSARQSALSVLRASWGAFGSQVAPNEWAQSLKDKEFAVKASYSYETVYTGSGEVIVKMKLPMSKVLGASPASSPVKGSSKIVFRVDGEAFPTMDITLVNAAGQTLYARSAHKDPNRVRLVPWLRNPSLDELKKHGAVALEALQVKASGRGTFVVDVEEWKRRKNELIPLIQSGDLLMVTR